MLQLDQPVAPVLEALAARGIVGGYDLTPHYPALGAALLVCATETRTTADLDTYARTLGEVLDTVTGTVATSASLRSSASSSSGESFST